MSTVHIAASTGYDVIIDRNILDTAGTVIQHLGKVSRVMLVSDDTVYSLYGEAAKKSVMDAGFAVSCFVFPHGEKSKTLSTYGELLEKMCESRLTRSDLVIALGGGVVGDLAGFAAATYQRGIRFIQIPTTLLSAVDASVGGKTAVDLAGGKNQVGCFHQPSCVLCDVDMLKTLPEEEYRCGCAEIIKYAMIRSPEFFEQLKNKPVSEQLEDVIAECVKIKRDFVLKDEFDNGERMKLNFGHTFGHGVEQCSGYTVLHGLGVSVGMAMMTKASVKKGLCPQNVYDSLIALLRKYGLPTECDYPAEKMEEAVLLDKKAAGTKIRLIVPEKIGFCRIYPVDAAEIREWLIAGGAHE